MKKLLAIFVLFVALKSSAQDYDWHFGVKADLNGTAFKAKGLASGYTSGFQAGAYIEKKFGPSWSLQPEIFFSQNNGKKGADFMTYYNTDGNVFAADNIKLGYLSVPVLAKYSINKYIQLLAGPQAGIMLFDAESLVHNDKGTAFKRYEFSAAGGVQFTFGAISLYGRYVQGLNNINNIDNRYKWHSNHIQGGVAVRII